MSEQIFTPSNSVDTGKERDWAANLGMLDWDSTSIVFTKRSLIEFLKYTGVTVDTNYTNISKLPRYAKFGKLAGGDTAVKSENADVAPTDDTSSTSDAYRPSRRVRHTPGGPTSNIFEEEFGDDALSQAPAALEAKKTEEKLQTADDSQTTTQATPQHIPRPSRRVRTAPGGKDSISALFGSEDVDQEAFRPTRNVRQAPGGQDSIGGIFGGEN